MKRIVLIALATAYSFFVNSQSLEIFQDNEAGRYGIKDKSGVILNCEYDKIDKLGENIFAVYKNNECGIYSPNKKEKIDLNYKKIYLANPEKYIVQVDSLYGIINSEGTVIVKPVYNEISGVNYNKAKYRENGLYGILDLNGNKILSAEYSNVFILKNGYITKKNPTSGWSYVSDNNNTEFEEVKEIDNEYEIKKDGKWGVMSENGEILADCVYDSAFVFGTSTSADTYFDGKPVTISKAKFFGLQKQECYVLFWTASNMVKYDKPITVKIYNYPANSLNSTLTIYEKSLSRPDCATESKNRIKLDKRKYQFAIEFDGIISNRRDLDITNESNCKIVELR